MLYKKAVFPIFFGDKNSCPVDWRAPEFQAYCTQLAQKLGFNHLVALKQVHGTDGSRIINKEGNACVSLFEQDGDYLITNQKSVALAVLTADCLPIIIHDKINSAVAAIHAGWPGTVAGITKKALHAMQKAFNTNPAQVQVYFGPSAKICCYEVQENFYAKFAPVPAAQLARIKQSIITRGNKLFFDNPGCNKLILNDCGVQETSIHDEHNICTICHEQYHSFRRDKENAFRQLTITWV